jgi:hypothetical protein
MKRNFVFKINNGKKSQSQSQSQTQTHVNKSIHNRVEVNKPVTDPVQPLSDFEKLFKNVPVKFAYNIRNAY